METKEQAKKRGKKSRKTGADFERKVREDLESKGWIVTKWMNTVEFGEAPKKIEGRYTIQDICDGKDYPKGTVRDEYGKPLKIGKCVPAKATWMKTPFGMRPMGMGSGFPDFIAYRRGRLYVKVGTPKHTPRQEELEQIREALSKVKPNEHIVTSEDIEITPETEVIFVESKMNGTLDKKEKEMAKWYLENNYCSEFLIAKKVKEGRKIKVVYEDFLEKYK